MGHPVEDVRASGLVVRSVFPRDVPPNDTPPAPAPESEPWTVGPNAEPGFGDTHVIYNGNRPPPQAQAWAGWPVGWATPSWWGSVESANDVAWACLDLNSSVIASMPAYAVDRSGLVLDAPTWLANPDPDLYSSWEEFAKQLAWDYQTGEVFVLCTARFATGWPARFHVVEPWTVNVEWRDGRRTYRIGGLDVTGDILHVRYKSTRTDARGHGPLEAGAARLVAASLLMRYATELVQNGGVPWGVITVPDDLRAGQASELQQQWLQSRMGAMGLPAVLSGGITLQALQYNAEQLALHDLSQLNESRICVLLGVPPFLMGLPSGGDSMTYSNVSSIFDYHWRAGLRPKVAPLMAALSLWVMPRGTGVELNRDEYVRPGLYERAQAYQLLHGVEDTTGRAITAQEIRTLERFTTIHAPMGLSSSGEF